MLDAASARLPMDRPHTSTQPSPALHAAPRAGRGLPIRTHQHLGFEHPPQQLRLPVAVQRPSARPGGASTRLAGEAGAEDSAPVGGALQLDAVGERTVDLTADSYLVEAAVEGRADVFGSEHETGEAPKVAPAT